MNKFIILIVTGLTCCVFSCQERLDLAPVSSLVYGNYWEDEESARVAIVGLHATMRDQALNLLLLGEVRSDLYGGIGFESPNFTNLIYQDVRVDNAPFENWAGFYTDLHRINDAIKNIPEIEFVENNEKQYLLGQAYGMRAYYYYVMLRAWGGVPLVTEPTETVDFSNLAKPRASEEEIMDHIKLDLDASLNAFGNMDHFKDGKRTYWSKAASLVLKGEVYIWSGVHLGGGPADFQQAKSALVEVVNMPELELLTNYESIFDYSNKNNNEIIFSFHYEVDQATNIYGNWTARQVEISSLYDSQGNIMGLDLSLSGGNRYHPSGKALDVLFEDPLDQRGDGTWVRLFRNPDATEYAGSVTNKFLGQVEAGVRRMIDDMPIYRYADAILLLAEAKNQLGEDPSDEINRIRERAYGDNYNPNMHAYVNQTQTLNTEAILTERFKEFQQEGKRWWDLRRAGDEYVIEHTMFLDPGDEYMLVLPITRDMIGRNSSLQQTPGYGQ